MIGLTAKTFFGGADVEYITERVENAPLSQMVSVTGSVVADMAVDLRFGQSGTVAEIRVVTGQEVIAGQELARIDTGKLESEVKRTAAAIAAEEADLNLMIVGPSEETKAVSKAKVHEAEIGSKNAAQSYENTLLTNAEHLRKAELTVENAKLDVETAQISYENTLAQGDTTSSQSNNALIGAYEDAQIAAENAFESAKQAKDAVDLLLGEDDEPLNYDFEDDIFDASFDVRNATYQSFKAVSSALETLDPEFSTLKMNWTLENGTAIDLFLAELELMLQDSKVMVNSTYDILEAMNTLNAEELSDIDTLKTLIESEQANTTNALDLLQNAIQNIETAKLSEDSSDLSSSTSLSDALSTLEQTKNQWAIAESDLEAQKVANIVDENEAQMNLDIKMVQLEQRKAEYAELVAIPREVDLAAKRARISQAIASHERSLSELEDGILRAPTEGIVAKVKIEKGQSIGSNEAAITFITPLIQISAQISESDITKVGLDNAASMTLDALPISDVFTGKVIELDPAETVLQGVVYYESTLLFDSMDERIKPGMTVNIDILTDERESALQISPQALQFEDKQTFVFLYERGEAVKRLVTTGLQGERKVEILSGLTEGDIVVLYTK